MHTKRLFWNDPYLKDCNANVIEINNDKIVLDQTIIYALSGGQESDSGNIGEYEVIEATKREDTLVYTLNKPFNGKVGDNVKVKIDWDKRYKLMRLHSAQHIVAEIVMQNYKDTKDAGGGISSNKARLDFSGIKFSEILKDIEIKVNKFISENHTIKLCGEEKDETRRLWEIEGFAKMNCSGTHVKNTSEIGKITLKRKSGGANIERLEIYLV